MYLLFETSPGWLPCWRVFNYYVFTFLWAGGWRGVGVGWGWGWGGGDGLSRYGGGALHPAPMYLLFGAVYWSLRRPGYFGVSNFVLVWYELLSLYALHFNWFIYVLKLQLVPCTVACAQVLAYARTVLQDFIWIVQRPHVFVSDQELLLICRSSLLLTKQ